MGGIVDHSPGEVFVDTAFRTILFIGIAGVISFLDVPPLEIASGIFVAAALLPIGERLLRHPEEPLTTRVNLAIAGAVAVYVIVLIAIVSQTPGGILEG